MYVEVKAIITADITMGKQKETFEAWSERKWKGRLGSKEIPCEGKTLAMVTKQGTQKKRSSRKAN